MNNDIQEIITKKVQTVTKLYGWLSQKILKLITFALQSSATEIKNFKNKYKQILNLT